jgi:hypothetical protein
MKGIQYPTSNKRISDSLDIEIALLEQVERTVKVCFTKKRGAELRHTQIYIRYKNSRALTSLIGMMKMED